MNELMYNLITWPDCSMALNSMSLNIYFIEIYVTDFLFALIFEIPNNRGKILMS